MTSIVTKITAKCPPCIQEANHRAYQSPSLVLDLKQQAGKLESLGLEHFRDKGTITMRNAGHGPPRKCETWQAGKSQALMHWYSKIIIKAMTSLCTAHIHALLQGTSLDDDIITCLENPISMNLIYW